jgi:dTMP kinase
MKGKLIVIEGTDCSGKQTQSELLCENLKKSGKTVVKFSFPEYDSATGRIIAGPYLGKPAFGASFFHETAPKVHPKVASLFYAADRLYNIEKIENALKIHDFVLLDRYIESNMAHQGGKFKNQKERAEMFDWLEKLEYDLLELPKPDKTILLYMPYEFSQELRKNRNEPGDEHEKSKSHIKDAENSYLELAKRNNFTIINCVENNRIRTPEEISESVFSVLK